MKRTTSTIVFATLMLAALVSCKKEDSSNETPTTTTTSSTTSSGTPNPLITKACKGVGDIEVNSVKDTVTAMEAVLPPLNLYGIYSDANWGSLTLQSGDKKLPAANKTFTVLGDPDKMPLESQMILEYYDGNAEVSYYATGGTVSYTISSSEKTVKFANITFKNDSGATKTISFEVKLK